MPKVVLAPGLSRWLKDPSMDSAETTIEVTATTLSEALAAAFAQHPRLRGYVLDEQAAVRHHVVVFVDGSAIRDKSNLSGALAPRSEVYVMQALSGG